MQNIDLIANMRCATCANLNQVKQKRVIYCKERGKTHPRACDCNKYIKLV